MDFMEFRSHGGGDFGRAYRKPECNMIPVTTTPKVDDKGIPWYLQREKRQKELPVMAENYVQLPLIQRVTLGAQYCTAEEWEAYQWLVWKLNTRVSVPNGSVSYAEWMRHESRYFGVCGLEVPFAQHNPQRPWIVNVLMSQMGAPLQNYKIWNVCVGTSGQVPNSVEFTYKTNEIGVVNDI